MASHVKALAASPCASPGRTVRLQRPKSGSTAWILRSCVSFLTLFYAGTLPQDNEILEFTQFDIVGQDVAVVTETTNASNNDWGGAGPKVLVTVRYTYKNAPIKCMHIVCLNTEQHTLVTGLVYT